MIADYHSLYDSDSFFDTSKTQWWQKTDAQVDAHTQTCEVVKLQLVQLPVWTNMLDWGPFIDCLVCQTWRTRRVPLPPHIPPSSWLLPPHSCTQNHPPRRTLPVLSPSPYAWGRTGASQWGDGKQADRRDTRSDPETRASHAFTYKQTHTLRSGVSDSHTLKRHGARCFILQATGDSSSHPGTVFFAFYPPKCFFYPLNPWNMSH